MKAAITFDTVSGKDYQAVLGIINQLGECQTREELNQIIKTLLLPLMGCNGAFYVRLEGEGNTPKLLDSINPSPHCMCRWKNFLEIATQSHLLDRSSEGEKNSLLKTEVFSYIERACPQCPFYPSNTSYQEYRNCAVVELIDSPNPAVALYLGRFTPQTQYYSIRDMELLQLMRVILLQTVKVIFFQEECHNLRQVLNFLPDHGEPLAVVSDDGMFVYKNQSFDLAVGQDKCDYLLTLLGQKITVKSGTNGSNYHLTQLSQRLYEVSMKNDKVVSNGNTGLSMLDFTRVGDKKQQIKRKFGKAGLSNRELEITALIYQGISAQKISAQLNLSYHTVRNHIRHIYRKIGVSTRSEMLTWGE